MKSVLVLFLIYLTFADWQDGYYDGEFWDGIWF